MVDVYRLKVVFINKETMTKIEDVHRIIVRPTYDGELIATYYDEIVTGKHLPYLFIV